MGEKLRISLSASAGIILNIDGNSIAIDAYHSTKLESYSTIDELYFAELEQNPDFSKPDIIAFTHLHDDHFSSAMTERILRENPDTALILPRDSELETAETRALINTSVNQLYSLEAERAELRMKGFKLNCIRLTHDGEQYRNVNNYAYIIERNGVRVLHSGDCAVADAQLAVAIDEFGPVDIALLNFPWLALGKGRSFIREHLNKSRLFAIHLPFEEDDSLAYNAMLARQLKRFEMDGLCMMNKRNMLVELEI